MPSTLMTGALMVVWSCVALRDVGEAPLSLAEVEQAPDEQGDDEHDRVDRVTHVQWPVAKDGGAIGVQYAGYWVPEPQPRVGAEHGGRERDGAQKHQDLDEKGYHEPHVAVRDRQRRQRQRKPECCHHREDD